MTTELAGGRLEATAVMLVPRRRMIERQEYLDTIREVLEAARDELRQHIGRSRLRRHSVIVAISYGVMTDQDGQPAPFRTFPCPEATHARVTVRVLEERSS